MYYITVEVDIFMVIQHSEHFVEKEKDENHFIQGPMNMVDGLEQTNLYFSCWR